MFKIKCFKWKSYPFVEMSQKTLTKFKLGFFFYLIYKYINKIR